MKPEVKTCRWGGDRVHLDGPTPWINYATRFLSVVQIEENLNQDSTIAGLSTWVEETDVRQGAPHRGA